MSIDPARRKDPAARAEMMNDCRRGHPLPARRRGAGSGGPRPQQPHAGDRRFDARTGRRLAGPTASPRWMRTSATAIAGAGRVTNPGCYATGAIALMRPLVERSFCRRDWPVTINAVSGYSGGGKALIAAFEDRFVGRCNGRQLPPLRHGRGAEAHRRDPRVLRARRPAAVHSERRPVRARDAGVGAAAALGDARAAEARRRSTRRLPSTTKGERYVTVEPLEETLAVGKASSLDARNPEPEGLNDTNRMTPVGLRQPRTRAGGAGGEARQPRQGRVRPGGAESQPDARA